MRPLPDIRRELRTAERDLLRGQQRLLGLGERATTEDFDAQWDRVRRYRELKAEFDGAVDGAEATG